MEIEVECKYIKKMFSHCCLYTFQETAGKTVICTGHQAWRRSLEMGWCLFMLNLPSHTIVSVFSERRRDLTAGMESGALWVD